MIDFFQRLLDTRDFPARWHCGQWTPGHGWLHIGSDLAIAGAYFAIPCVLVAFAYRRRDVPFLPIFWLFALFILACGAGHLVEATLFWEPWYRLSGLLKLLTALASWATVIALFPTLPRALALPGLKSANERLRAEARQRERAEAGLRATRDELARSNAELRQFASAASHDLREPLRMVSSYMDLLRHRHADQLDARARECVDIAADGATRLQAMIDGLLTYARAGGEATAFRPVPLEAACERALEHLSVAIEEAGAVVTRDPLPVVHGEEHQLVLLLQNLIGNGIKFCGDEAARVHITAEEDTAAGCWRVRVLDEGIGVAEDDSERVFEVFERLHTQDEFPGSGIGLAICRKVVERHGGSIRMSPRDGGGTEVEFSLPRAPR